MGEEVSRSLKIHITTAPRTTPILVSTAENAAVTTTKIIFIVTTAASTSTSTTSALRHYDYHFRKGFRVCYRFHMPRRSA